jgi:MFS transporter, DHA2 family, multidrug resistance protein
MVKADAPGNPEHINPWLIAIAVMLSTFMEVLDTTVVNVSLPHIAGSLSASTDEATWTLTSYLVSNAIILPITGWLANYFGRKRFLTACVIGFTAASFMCGLAPTLGFLIVFRVIQGACGGGLQPISQAVLLESFPAEDRGKAMGFWGLGIVVAPMLGPVLGGWLTDSFSWRWVFYINIPIGVVAVIMTRLFIFDPSYIRRTSKRVDSWGLGMLAVGIASAQVVLDKGQEKDWFGTRWITVLTVLSLTALAAFVIHELRTREPVVNLRVFKERNYATGVFMMSIMGVVLYGSIVMIPLILQTLLAYPAYQAGVTMVPRGLGSFIAMPLIGMILGKIDARKLLILGVAVCSATLYFLGRLSLNAGYWNFFWPQLFMGLSLGCLFVPLTTVTMDPIPREAMGNATSLFNLVRNLGGSVGISAVATIQQRQQQRDINVLGANVNALNPLARSQMSALRQLFISRGSGPVEAMQQAEAAMFRRVQQQAAMISYNHVFILLALLFIAVLPLVFLMKRAKPNPQLAAH